MVTLLLLFTLGFSREILYIDKVYSFVLFALFDKREFLEAVGFPCNSSLLAFSRILWRMSAERKLELH